MIPRTAVGASSGLPIEEGSRIERDIDRSRGKIATSGRGCNLARSTRFPRAASADRAASSRASAPPVSIDFHLTIPTIPGISFPPWLIEPLDRN